ncbi:MAG: YHS domain protein [Bacteroidetes bacterium]|nr:YHS domain protein [Bacteroidota bacterium]
MKNLFLIIGLLISFGKGIKAQQICNTTNGVALSGYDPVSYFTAGKAVEGSKNISYNQAGVTYYFASETNRNLFKKSPTSFEPQYGGWCAYAMGKTGEKVEVDPETFKIINGKLYLFYNAYFNNTLPKWNKDEVSLKALADKNWNNLLKK